MSIYSICTGVTIYPKNCISGPGLPFMLNSRFKDPLQADLHPLDSQVLPQVTCFRTLLPFDARWAGTGGSMDECLGRSTDYLWWLLIAMGIRA